MTILIDLTGERFERLLVVERAENNSRGQARWTCKCDCGNIVVCNSADLRSGRTLSCGCYQKETVSKEEGHSAAHRLYYAYRDRAKRKNIKFDLSEIEFKKFVKQNCYYCKTEPSNLYLRNYMNGGFVYNGIDRINNDKGYTKDNIVPCCSTCNYAKRNMTQKEFFSWISKVYNHSVKNGNINPSDFDL